MFDHMDTWDWALAAAAVYMAVVSLVRLMAAERRRLLAAFHATPERPDDVPAGSAQRRGRAAV